MIVGSPEERFPDLMASYRFIMRMALAGFSTVGINKFVTYPGSEFHEEFRSSGKIEYTDRYFLGLHVNNAFDQYYAGLGYEPHWSARQVWWIVNVGYLLFFGTYYLSRPARIVQSTLSIVRNEPRNRMECLFAQWLQDARQRLALVRK
jgi:hypothetical protein